MKVLLVCSRRNYSPFTDYMAPFVYEQMKSLQALGIQCHTILVQRGIKGYFRAYNDIRNTIRTFSPDIIHAHYGLCGLIAGLQRTVPVVTTFHGTDLHDRRLRLMSRIAANLSKKSIVVSQELKEIINRPERVQVIPCGINTEYLVPLEKSEARLKLGWSPKDKYILFSKEFYNKAKNYPLAKAAIEEYNHQHDNSGHATLLEFIGYNREQVLWLYNAVDCVLMTSHHEGSPQFIKEAMACNCPIVSVDVGDVRQVISGTDGCYIAERNAKDIAQKIDAAIKYGRTNGRAKILAEFGSQVIASKIIKIYEGILGYE